MSQINHQQWEARARTFQKALCKINDPTILDKIVKPLPLDIDYNKLRDEITHFIVPHLKKPLDTGVGSWSQGVSVTNTAGRLNGLEKSLFSPLGMMKYLYDNKNKRLIEKSPHFSWKGYDGDVVEDLSGVYVDDNDNILAFDDQMVHLPSEILGTEIERVGKVINDYLGITDQHRIRISFGSEHFLPGHSDPHTPYRVQIQLSGQARWTFNDYNTKKYVEWDQTTDNAFLIRTQTRHQVEIGSDLRIAIMYQIYTLDIDKVGWQSNRDGTLYND